MRIIFAGTPETTLPVLHTILSSRHDVVAILTQPDRPAGRGLKLHRSAVKQEALAHGLTIVQPQQFTPQTITQIATLQADLMITMSYGMLLPDEILARLSVGCINIHTSLLPRWRGAAPIARAIEAGDTESGISLVRSITKLDAGPIIAQHPCPITADDTTRSLELKLATLATNILGQLLSYDNDRIHQHIAHACSQPKEGITYAKKISKKEAWIDWNNSASIIANKIRAYNPWPIAQTYLEGQLLKILSARVCSDDVETARIKTTKHNVFAGCGEGTLELLEVQPPGGTPMSATAYANGHRINDTVLEMYDPH